MRKIIVKQVDKNAEKYIHLMPFSKQGFTDQLVSEDFTKSEAEHGAKAVGSNIMNKICKACGSIIPEGYKRCPECGARNKKPFYLRGWFIALLCIILVSFVISIAIKIILIMNILK